MSRSSIVMQPVDSSNISAIGFGKGKGKNRTNLILIKFSNGRVYEYNPVPEIIWKNRLNYEKISDWFSNEIRSNSSLTYKEIK